METEAAKAEYGIETSNEQLNLSNFAQYSLIPLEDINLLEGDDVKYSNEAIWQSSMDIPTEQGKCDDVEDLTPSQISMLKEIDKMLKRENESSPCVGQGDGPNTSLLSPIGDLKCNQTIELHFPEPDKNMDEDEAEAQQAVYANLEPAKMSCVNFSTPQAGYHHEILPPPVVTSSPCDGPKLMAFPDRKPLGRKRRGSTLQRLVPRQILKQTILSPYDLHQLNSSGSSLSSSGGASADYSFPSASSSSFEGCGSVLQDGDASLEYPKPPNNTPTSEDPEEIASTSQHHSAAMSRNMIFTPSTLNSRLEKLTHYPDMRETHNAKERKRRSRIRDACQEMRRLLPGMNDRTDNATVFELFAEYVDFLRDQVKDQYDMEYLCQNQMWNDQGPYIVPK